MLVVSQPTAYLLQSQNPGSFFPWECKHIFFACVEESGPIICILCKFIQCIVKFGHG